MTRLDGGFWSRYFETIFVPQLNVFCDAVLTRVLPAFSELEREAEAAADAEWARLLGLPAGESDDIDFGHLAEKATEVGFSYHEALAGVRQAVLNLTVAALYHILEQQLLLFHRMQLLHPTEENDTSLINLTEVMNRLLHAGVDLRSLESWSHIDEVRLICNAVKHAEGSSSEKLKSMRPELFIHPDHGDENGMLLSSPGPVYLPLAGQDIFLSVDDLEAYRSAIEMFWEEFGRLIRGHGIR